MHDCTVFNKEFIPINFQKKKENTFLTVFFLRQKKKSFL